jgi:hypothetical protein
VLLWKNLEKLVVFWNGLLRYTVVLGVVPVISGFAWQVLILTPQPGSAT